MEKQFKPVDYNSVSPYFIVDGAQKLIDMLVEIFNANELRRYDMPNGTIMHVEVQIDDSVIMIADSSQQYPANKFLIHVYVQNVDDIFNKAINIGCEPVELPMQKEGDPDRRGSFK
jgi:PhnB protein